MSLKKKRFYSSKMFYFLISVIVAFASEWTMEYLIEDALSEYGLSRITIPIALSIGILTNIALTLNFDIIDKIPNVEHLQKQIKADIDSTERLLSAMHDESRMMQDIYSRIKKRNSFLRDFSTDLISTYMKGFRNTERGIELSGEYWALKTYLEFWDFLVKVQIERKAINKEPIIARCTHSNDINIWNENDRTYKEFTYDLIRMQSEFIRHGGKIVRVFIGEEEQANSVYITVMNRMNNIGMETKYLSQNDIVERSFDFMYLPDEELNMKWFSGSRGKRLAKCIIEDAIDDEVRSAWNAIWDKLVEKGDPIKSIDKNREHDRRA